MVGLILIDIVSVGVHSLWILVYSVSSWSLNMKDSSSMKFYSYPWMLLSPTIYR